MAYYPKSQVKTNLFTNGGEFIRNDNKLSYQGYYWTNSKGEYFSGKTPQEVPSIKLLKEDQRETNELVSVPKKDANWYSFYPNSVVQNKPGTSPNKKEPKPTEADYNVGEFTRYFTKKSNQNIYYEISKSDYSKLINQNDNIQWQLYQPIKIIWDLQGTKEEVYKANRNTVLIAEQRQKLPGFRKIFRKDYLQYYKD